MSKKDVEITNLSTVESGTADASAETTPTANQTKEKTSKRKTSKKKKERSDSESTKDREEHVIELDRVKIIRDANSYSGLLFIGDPHLEGRVPGFRKDNYPQVILEKLRWCINYCREFNLLPVFLGDLFHVPRDNPNWLIVELLELFQKPVVGVYGNHDVRENQLSENDSLSILVESERYLLVSPESLLQVTVNDRTVYLGGSSWGQPFPTRFEHFSLGQGGQSLAFWISHHDIRIDGQYDAGDLEPYEIDGIDAVINGHIHRKLETVVEGSTQWITPGNISRRKRDDATREHIPAVLRVDIGETQWTSELVEVEHAPFDEVFHEAIVKQELSDAGSAFVAGLAQLEQLKTESGQGLHEFLEQNLSQFEEDVAHEIKVLAKEVTKDEN